MHRVRIDVPGGDWTSATIIDLDTGRPLDNVVEVKWELAVGRLPRLTVVFEPYQVEVNHDTPGAPDPR